jgi:hypothetical protein
LTENSENSKFGSSTSIYKNTPTTPQHTAERKRHSKPKNELQRYNTYKQMKSPIDTMTDNIINNTIHYIIIEMKIKKIM